MTIVLNGTEGITTPDITAPTTTLSSLNNGQLAGMRNKIINGKMEIAQRGTSWISGNHIYTADRWATEYVADGGATASIAADAPNSEFQYSLRSTQNTADTSIGASQYGGLAQTIEGYNARDLIGRAFTLSFWVRSAKTGTHCVAFRNGVADRSYVVEYTVNAANTWEYKTITVSGGLITAGTWNWTNGAGLDVWFATACGSTYQTTAGAWQTGNFIATANQVNCLDTVGNIFAITGVQLEVGEVATPFEHRPYGTELALCQRYYYRIVGDDAFGTGWCGSTVLFRGVVVFPTEMRIAPSGLEQSGTASDYAVQVLNTEITCSSVPAFSAATKHATRLLFTVASGLTAGQSGALNGLNANAYLGFSAEL